MGTDARTRVSSAETNGTHEHPLISEARARQLFELALALRAADPPLRTSIAMLAAVIADLHRGDGLLTQSAVPCAESLNTRSATGAEFADQIVESLSAATQDRLRKNGRVTAIFLPPTSDDAMVAESLALASAARLPVLFVQDERAITRRAAPGRASAILSIPVDASDVIALYRVAHESIARARTGNGPTHMKCVPWQVSGNRHKSKKTGDPLDKLEKWLAVRGYAAPAWREAFAARSQSAHRAPAAVPTTAEQPAFAAGRQLFARPDIQTN